MRRIIRNSLPAMDRGISLPGIFVLTLFHAFINLYSSAIAQLSGTYTIGAGRNYSTIESAISALASQGVQGPVTFLIDGGTYTAPAGGYTLSQVASMNVTNTVTFRPGANGTVTITGNSSTGIFNFSGGDYYILDGSSVPGGAGRDWKIINSSTSGRAVRFLSGATHNIIRNMHLMGNSAGVATGGIILFNTSSSGGNSHNRISSNTLGDPAGVHRSTAGIAMSGSAGSNSNEGNSIEGNDIINFGRAPDNGYGIYISANNRLLKILGNRVMITPASGMENSYGIYIANASGSYDTIARNTIHGSHAGFMSGGMYGIHISSQSPDPIIVHHNMISLLSEGGMLTGISTASGDPLYIEHNTISMGGSAAGSSASQAILNSAGTAIIHVRNNILVNLRSGAASNASRVLYNSARDARIISDCNLYFTNGAVLAYQSGTYYNTLQSYQAATGRDTNSVFHAVNFAGHAGENLHIAPLEPFMGEGIGMPLGYVRDFDGDLLDTIAPDIGADEGSFIGMGINLLAPDGNETLAIDYDIDAVFTANRTMKTRVELSTNNGRSWEVMAARIVTRGRHTVTITMPARSAAQALVRVVNAGDEREHDISHAPFQLVHPVLRILAPNGGERLMPTDTVLITWTASLTTPAMRLWLEQSVDDGASWAVINSDLTAVNLPAINSYSWIVPDTPTEHGMLRARIGRGVVSDRTDAPFTIVVKPDIEMLEPAAGEKLFAGDTIPIRWRSVATDYVRPQYSTDGGASWHNVVTSGVDIPAFLGRYSWVVPDAPSANVVVRLVNVEHTRFQDMKHFTIARSSIVVLEPNGGERYEMGAPVTVRWEATEMERVSLQYSGDNGASWSTVVGDIDARAGFITFTPISTATRTALVRLAGRARPRVQDRSDASFEILSPRGITVYEPVTGERLLRNSTTTISWDASHSSSVTIQFSPNGGATWQTQATNISAGQGSYTWTVPGSTTMKGRIRIVDAGGQMIGESGIFAVVDQEPRALQLLEPNGGEIFIQGDMVVVRWTATGLMAVDLFHSTDAGRTWNVIQRDIAASAGAYAWQITGEPGTEHRVKIQAPEGIQDASDASFTIRSRPRPSLVLLYPNGGERLAVDSIIDIRWQARDIAGDVSLEYSGDGGVQWNDVATVPALSERYQWIVPNDTGPALLRISGAGKGITDVSDRMWEIYLPEPITIARPNGGETWLMEALEAIEWHALPTVQTVDILYSTDGGGTWMPVEADMASTPGLNRYMYRVPQFSSEVKEALVQIRNSTDTNQRDISNAVFRIARAPVASIAGQDTITPHPRLLGSFPNPFGSTTEVRWIQACTDQVHLMLYDRHGRRVRIYDLGYRDAGTNRCMLSGNTLESGAYTCELRIGRNILRGIVMVIH